MMMDKSQIGRPGELAIELYALVTSGGEVDIFSPVVDDDHVDLVAGVRGGLRLSAPVQDNADARPFGASGIQGVVSSGADSRRPQFSVRDRTARWRSN